MKIRTIAMGLATATLLLLGSAPVSAGECARSCRDEAKDCFFDAAEASKLCFEGFGCDLLLVEYREVCLVYDRDEVECEAARDAFRSCADPCHQGLREDARVCGEQTRSCLADSCSAGRPGKEHRFQSFFSR